MWIPEQVAVRCVQRKNLIFSVTISFVIHWKEMRWRIWSDASHKRLFPVVTSFLSTLTLTGKPSFLLGYSWCRSINQVYWPISFVDRSSIPDVFQRSCTHARRRVYCALDNIDEIARPTARWERNIKKFVWEVASNGRYSSVGLAGQLYSLGTDCVFLEWTVVLMFLQSRRKKTGYFGVKWSAHNIWFDILFGKVSPFRWSSDRSQLRLKQSKIVLLKLHLNRWFVFSYTESRYLYVVYILIALHFLSGVAVSDRTFRHALGFAPHLLGLGYTSYLFYSNILHQLTPWIKVRHRMFRQEWMFYCFE